MHAVEQAVLGHGVVEEERKPSGRHLIPNVCVTRNHALPDLASVVAHNDTTGRVEQAVGLVCFKALHSDITSGSSWSHQLMQAIQNVWLAWEKGCKPPTLLEGFCSYSTCEGSCGRRRLF
eukprot:713792-Amphidinium_carterae.1